MGRGDGVSRKEAAGDELRAETLVPRRQRQEKGKGHPGRLRFRVLSYTVLLRLSLIPGAG